MLIKALNEYYDILARNDKVCKDGFSRQNITHMIMLRKDGTVSDIINVEQESEPDSKGKTKLQPISVVLPERTQKPGIDGNIVEHRPLYIFGLNYDNKSGTYSTEDSTDKAKKSHKAFVDKNLEFTEGMTSDIVTAYRNFLQKWNPQDENENELLVNLGKAYSTANFIFGLDGHPEIKLHDTDGEIAQKITELKKSVGPVQGNDICAVTGEKGEISVTHDKIKGVRNANATGALMVCVNNTAECSYGKEQAYNSSITQTTMKHYTEALNTLIADKNHRIYLDDMTVVFWAMSDDDSKETDLFASMLGFDDKIDADEMNGILLKSLNDVNQGKSPDFTELDIDKNVEFYIVGIAPNVSRLAQKFIYRDKFGNIFSHIARHQADMMIVNSKGNIPMWRIFRELKPPQSTNYTTPPPLMASVFGAIINGTHYPESLLENAVRRMKTDKSVNYVRAGIIKACINRKDRYSKNKEEIKMALDIENNNQAYLCGRLFAVLEKVQIESVKGYRKPYSCQLIYRSKKSNHCFNIHFSGMDDMNAQILNFPFQAHFIPVDYSIQIQCLFHWKICRKTVDPAILLTDIKKICLQFSFQKCMPFIQAHFFYCHLPLILNHTSNVRFYIRYIVIHIKCYLAGCLALCP